MRFAASKTRPHDLRFRAATDGRGRSKFGCSKDEALWRCFDIGILLFRSHSVFVICSESFAGFLSPNPCLACYLPGHRLLNTVPTAHPYVFRPVENGSKKWRPIKVLVCGNFLQHLEHSPEMTPHYRKAEDSTGRGALLQNPL